MLVLHGIWDNTELGKFHLWLESSVLWQQLQSQITPTNTSTAKTNPQPHPFAGDYAQLEAILTSNSLVTNAKTKLEFKKGELILALPSCVTATTNNTSKRIWPQPSPPLQFEITNNNSNSSDDGAITTAKRKSIAAKLQLKEWQILTLRLEPASVLDFLLELPTFLNTVSVEMDLTPEVSTEIANVSERIVAGDSIIFWAEAVKLALELLARQSFIPTVRIATTNNSGGIYPVWQADFSEERVQKRLRLLAQALPPFCRMVRHERNEQAAPLTPVNSASHLAVVSSFIDWIMDGFIRREIHQANFLPRSLKTVSENTAKSPLPEQWISNLWQPYRINTSSSSDAKDVPQQPLQLHSTNSQELENFVKNLWQWLGQANYGEETTNTPLTVAATPFRTCFKLEPPAEELADSATTKAKTTNAETWQLSFYLQANEDRSLLVPAEQVWQTRGGTLTFLQHQFENPQERLLADLGRAIHLFPPLETSLKSAKPVGMSLTTPQAYDFLRQAAPLLEQSGLGVLLPSWWLPGNNQKQLGIKLNLKTKRKKGEGAKTTTGLLGLEGIISYDWQVAIGNSGEQTLSPQEFEKLAQLKVPLVKLRGQWVEIKPEDIAAVIAFFEKQHANGEMTLGEALRLGLGGEQVAGSDIPVVGVNAEGTLKELLDKLTQPGKIEELTQPQGLTGALRPYQLQGLSWLNFLHTYGLGSCLADDMGLGKSIQTISLILHDFQTRPEIAEPAQAESSASASVVLQRKKVAPFAISNGSTNVSSSNNEDFSNGESTLTSLEEQTEPLEKEVRPVLVVCPMSVVGNWQREFARFAPSLRVMVHHGNSRLSGEALAAEVYQHEVVITTYALVQRDLEELSAIKWRGLVLDEAQNIKNSQTKQAQAVRALPASYKIALTGTPVENRLSELWSIMDFLNPGYLGTASKFRQNLANPIERYHDQEKSQRLKQLIQPFVLRRLKTDKSIIADLPDKLEMKVYANLTSEQATLYEAVVKEMLEKIEGAAADGIERKGLVLSTLLKLKQVCNHPAQFTKETDFHVLAGRSGKMERLEEMLEEALAEGDKALIFTQFTEMGSLLKPYLQEKLGTEVLYLHGGVTKPKRDEMVARFQATENTHSNSPRLFLLSLKAGGVGLNLTAANHVFHFDRWWNPAVENQATDRAFRIGQQKNVQVHKFVCAGTLEERIDQMIEQKRGLAASIVGSNSGENWLTELSTSELRELFQLSRDIAVV